MTVKKAPKLSGNRKQSADRLEDALNALHLVNSMLKLAETHLEQSQCATSKEEDFMKDLRKDADNLFLKIAMLKSAIETY